MREIILVIFFLSIFAKAETIFIGADVGVSSLKSSISNEIESKTGMALDLKVFYNIYIGDSWNTDLGLGYLNNQFKGSSNNNTVTIKSKLAYLDLDLKYNLTKQFSAGPVLNYFIGTNTNFSEIEDGSNSNMMPGLKIAYRLSTEIPMRIDARLITSNNEAKALIALVGFSIGIDINQKLKSESNPNLVKFNSPALKVEIMPPLELEEEKPDLVISLKSARVLFDANAYALDQELEAKLRRLAKYLILNEDQYSKLKISGHTDNRGSRDYNIDLSRNRAESVAKVFIKAGVAGNRVSARGYGYDRPLVSGSKPGALEKNRRTEIEFFGIKNRDRFNKALTDILK